MPGRLWFTGFLVGGIAAVFVGCAEGTGSSRPVKPHYDRLGGKEAITAVVDQFVANVAAGARINGRFATTDMPKLKRHLIDQVCMATGGPCSYTRRDMKTAHAGIMKITNADFDALVQDLVRALNKFRVPEREQRER